MQSYISRAFKPFHLHSSIAPPPESLLWISASPNLKYFDLPLLQNLNKSYSVARWEYLQSLDEGSSLDKAVNLLVDYLKQCDRSIHLAGHGISGVVAMMAANRVPELVKSLTLLGVAAQPGATWHAHYYLHRLATPCSQQRVLAKFCRTLFGLNTPHSVQTLVKLLAADLATSPSPHSLFHIANLDAIVPKVPMLVCAGALDFVTSPDMMELWAGMIKPSDRIISIPEGRHFFHYHFPDRIAMEMNQFWSQETTILNSVYSV